MASFIRRSLLLGVFASANVLCGCSLIGAGIGSAVPRYEARSWRELHVDDEVRVDLLRPPNAGDVLPRGSGDHVDGRYAGTHDGMLRLTVDGLAEPREIPLTEIGAVRIRDGSHWAAGLIAGGVVDATVLTLAVIAADSTSRMQLDVGGH
jgi:hypothetical protein